MQKTRKSPIAGYMRVHKSRRCSGLRLCLPYLNRLLKSNQILHHTPPWSSGFPSFSRLFLPLHFSIQTTRLLLRKLGQLQSRIRFIPKIMTLILYYILFTIHIYAVAIALTNRNDMTPPKNAFAENQLFTHFASLVYTSSSSDVASSSSSLSSQPSASRLDDRMPRLRANPRRLMPPKMPKARASPLGCTCVAAVKSDPEMNGPAARPAAESV